MIRFAAIQCTTIRYNTLQCKFRRWLRLATKTLLLFVFATQYGTVQHDANTSGTVVRALRLHLHLRSYVQYDLVQWLHLCRYPAMHVTRNACYSLARGNSVSSFVRISSETPETPAAPDKPQCMNDQIRYNTMHYGTIQHNTLQCKLRGWWRLAINYFIKMYCNAEPGCQTTFFIKLHLISIITSRPLYGGGLVNCNILFACI